MTEENKRLNVAREIANAEEALHEARILMANKLYKGAVSRAYYHALHAARAMLFTVDLEPKSHEGAKHLLNLHFVRSGRIAPQTARHLATLFTNRQDADYETVSVFDEATAATELEHAVQFGETIRALLQQDGWL